MLIKKGQKVNIHKYNLFLIVLLSINVFANEIATCPKTTELIKNEESAWSTKTNWKSYNQSFIKKINKFISAQWQGEHVGKLLCTYSGESKLTFPVTLQAPFLTKTPTGKNWEKPQKENIFNCYGPDVNNCQLNKVIIEEKKINTDDELSDFLQSIKSTKNP